MAREVFSKENQAQVFVAWYVLSNIEKDQRTWVIGLKKFFGCGWNNEEKQYVKTQNSPRLVHLARLKLEDGSFAVVAGGYGCQNIRYLYRTQSEELAKDLFRRVARAYGRKFHWFYDTGKVFDPKGG